jgi:hypothetical protein
VIGDYRGLNESSVDDEEGCDTGGCPIDAYATAGFKEQQ